MSFSKIHTIEVTHNKTGRPIWFRQKVSNVTNFFGTSDRNLSFFSSPKKFSNISQNYLQLPKHFQTYHSFWNWPKLIISPKAEFRFVHYFVLINITVSKILNKRWHEKKTLWDGSSYTQTSYLNIIDLGLRSFTGHSDL